MVIYVCLLSKLNIWSGYQIDRGQALMEQAINQIGAHFTKYCCFSVAFFLSDMSQKLFFLCFLSSKLIKITESCIIQEWLVFVAEGSAGV